MTRRALALTVLMVAVVAAAGSELSGSVRLQPAGSGAQDRPKPVPAPTAAPAKPSVRASVDRTAMWPGDRLIYTVEISSLRGFDVLEDDLNKDKLKLEGLDIVSTDTSRSEDPGGGATRRFRYVLTSYKVDTPSLRIAPLSVRYYATRAGQRLEDSAPAGAVDVPAASVALRSMLPDNETTFALRDRRPASDRPAVYAMAHPIGLGLIVLSIVPAVAWGAALVGRRRVRKPGRSVRQVRRAERASLEAVKAMDVRLPEDRRNAFNQIDGIVREHLHDVWGIPGPSLTPAEVAPALSGRRGRIPAETVASLLAACEAARYAPPASMPSAEACREAIVQTEELLGAR